MFPLPASHQADLEELPTFYWWHRTRIELVGSLVGRFLKPGASIGRYLDIGGGTGSTTLEIARSLMRAGIFPASSADVVCLEGDLSLKPLQRKEFIQFVSCDLEADWNAPHTSFEMFTALDVLEHLSDPVRFLSRAAAHLVSGGMGVLTAPAFEHLYSGWDSRLGHKRRYTRRLIADQCAQAGLTVVWSSYFFSFAFPFAFFQRKWGTAIDSSVLFPRVPGWLNTLLLIMGKAEIQMMRVLRIPFGTSVAVVVKKD